MVNIMVPLVWLAISPVTFHTGGKAIIIIIMALGNFRSDTHC